MGTTVFVALTEKIKLAITFVWTLQNQAKMKKKKLKKHVKISWSLCFVAVSTITKSNEWANDHTAKMTRSLEMVWELFLYQFIRPICLCWLRSFCFFFLLLSFVVRFGSAYFADFGTFRFVLSCLFRQQVVQNRFHSHHIHLLASFEY